MPPLSDDATDPTPDPFFDPAIFHCENGAYEDAAAHLAEGDDYRKGSLGLDATAAAELARHLAARGLALVDDDTHWLIAAAPPPKDEPPAAPAPTAPLREEPTPCCPICGELALPGRETCGQLECIEALGTNHRRNRGARR